MEKSNNLSGKEWLTVAAGAIYGTGMYLHGIKLFVGRRAYDDLTEHIGDFSLVTIPVAGAKIFSESVINYGKERNSKLIEKVGEYLPQIASGLSTAYFALGESILPQILPGTADPKDIPAVLVAGLSSALLFRNKK